MNIHNIIIFEFDSLYKILSEIKNNLPFKINNLKKLESKDSNFVEYSLVITNYINKNFLLKERKIDKNKILFLTKEKKNNQHITYPIQIKNLIEKINIKLIKQKYNNQSYLKVSNYILNLNSRIISKNNNSLKLTEKEINIILFLNDHKNPQKVSILQNQVWGYLSELETHTVETHIYRLRKKINDHFNDSNFIISTDDGYLIK
jgi:DNA-binding response OmpR family regulator|tara:strand:+ start:559 stop:1170 length:612 start_codon:yes stop_codon:yes gene_type:complete